MQCPKCQTANPENAKFCIECASPLEIICSRCGATNPAKAKFCMECAKNLQDHRENTPANQPESIVEAPGTDTKNRSDLAEWGEILVGQATYRGCEGYFTFESLEPARVKGKQEPVPIYRLLSAKDEPITTRRAWGLTSELIGRLAKVHSGEAGRQPLLHGGGHQYLD